MERMMKIQEVLLRAMAKKITWWQAASPGHGRNPLSGRRNWGGCARCRDPRRDACLQPRALRRNFVEDPHLRGQRWPAGSRHGNDGPRQILTVFSGWKTHRVSVGPLRR